MSEEERVYTVVDEKKVMTDEEVEAYNRRELWRDVTNHLTIARESVEQAQGALEDLHQQAYADLLQPIVDDLRRAANDAAEGT
jgi:hypothetical protein